MKTYYRTDLYSPHITIEVRDEKPVNHGHTTHYDSFGLAKEAQVRRAQSHYDDCSKAFDKAKVKLQQATKRLKFAQDLSEDDAI